MDKLLISKQNRIETSVNVLAKNATPVKNFPRLNTAAEALTTYLSAIHTHNDLLSVGSKGLSKSKTMVREMLVESVYLIARLALVWARDGKDKQLEAIFDVSRTALNYLSDVELEARCNRILKEISDVREALIPYRVDEADINTAMDLHADFKTKMSQPQTAIKTGKTARENLEDLFRKAELELETIDNLLGGLQKEAPEFVREFRASMSITDVSVRRTGIGLQLLDSSTQNPVALARAAVAGTKKSDESGPNGVCEFYQMRAGNYDVNITAPGYKPATIRVEVAKAKISRVNVVLERE